MLQLAERTQATDVLLLAQPNSFPEILQSHLPDTVRLTVVHEKYHFIRELLKNTADLVIADQELPCFNGLEVLRWVRNYQEELPFIYLYDPVSPSFAVEALLQGASACMSYEEIHMIYSIMKSAQLSHPDFAIDQRSRRIKSKIRENLEGLNEIKSYWNEDGQGLSDTFANSIREELEISIAYLEKLDQEIS